MSQRPSTDFRGRPVVAITGIGVVTSLGQGIADNWAALTAGHTGIHTITRFPVDGLKTTFAGTIDFMASPQASASDRTHLLAQAAVREAIGEAELPLDDFGGPLFLAAPPVELEWPQRFALHDAGAAGNDFGYARMLRTAGAGDWAEAMRSAEFANPAARLQEEFGFRGLPITLSTACASGATAIQFGVEALRRGEADRVVVAGADGSVTAEALIRFSLLSALSTHNEEPEKASRPFSKNRDGFAMAEGAGALVLETLDAARARGAKVLGFLRGCGERADDFHRTRSKPDGSPAIAAVHAALADAGVDETGIDYINAHGTSTPENDKMEYLSLHSVFGDRLHGIPVSSNKSMIGHTLTAAGAVEAIFSLLTIRNGVIPPTINHDMPDPAIPLDCVPNVCRSARVTTVLSNSFGFGGQNACLVIAAEPA